MNLRLRVKCGVGGQDLAVEGDFIETGVVLLLWKTRNQLQLPQLRDEDGRWSCHCQSLAADRLLFVYDPELELVITQNVR
jgi:hypothetical protein